MAVVGNILLTILPIIVCRGESFVSFKDVFIYKSYNMRAKFLSCLVSWNFINLVFTNAIHLKIVKTQNFQKTCYQIIIHTSGKPNLAKIVFNDIISSLPPRKHNSNHILYESATNKYSSVPNFKISALILSQALEGIGWLNASSLTLILLNFSQVQHFKTKSFKSLDIFDQYMHIMEDWHQTTHLFIYQNNN